ncbi:uncharacterized protein [Epargyreus clarus]|uniref:uncharacterized protein n=1 Tax=Epargyreus clarus TaxID=520877 RepID=UPI003C30CBDE
MSSDDYSIQNIYRYSRKSYKKSRNGVEGYSVSPREDINIEVAETIPRNERYSVGTPGCSCDIDPEGELANILHRKCPVIALAQQQLQKLLDETDVLLCDNTRCCRSVIDFLQICKEALWNQNKCRCAAVVIMLCIFVLGLILGAASCGANSGKFNSPILTCVDNFFIPDTYPKIEDTYRSIV